MAAAAPQKGSFGMAKSILIVEDDNNIADLLRLYLEKEGYQATIAADGTQLKGQITELQEDIEARDFSVTAGGGAVEVVLTGKKTIKSLTLKPEVVDPEDIEMLQDLIISAVNEAVNNIESTTEAEMSQITGGVSLPGLF